MLLRKAEVQYVAEMPFDKSTVIEFAAVAAAFWLCLRPLESLLRPKRPNVSSQWTIL